MITDSHYYSEPLGTPHPFQVIDSRLDLKENLEKMRSALTYFAAEDAVFSTVLGDLFEDHFIYDDNGSKLSTGA